MIEILKYSYGEYWYLVLTVSFIITWTIGLLPPILLTRYIFKQSIQKWQAILTVILLLILNIYIFVILLKSESKTHFVLYLIAFVSYKILTTETIFIKTQSATKNQTKKDTNQEVEKPVEKNDKIYQTETISKKSETHLIAETNTHKKFKLSKGIISISKIFSKILSIIAIVLIIIIAIVDISYFNENITRKKAIKEYNIKLTIAKDAFNKHNPNSIKMLIESHYFVNSDNNIQRTLLLSLRENLFNKNKPTLIENVANNKDYWTYSLSSTHPYNKIIKKLNDYTNAINNIRWRSGQKKLTVTNEEIAKNIFEYNFSKELGNLDKKTKSTDDCLFSYFTAEKYNYPPEPLFSDLNNLIYVNFFAILFLIISTLIPLLTIKLIDIYHFFITKTKKWFKESFYE